MTWSDCFKEEDEDEIGGHETPSGDPEEDHREEGAIQGSVSNPPLNITTSEAAEVAGRDADDEDEEQVHTHPYTQINV